MTPRNTHFDNNNDDDDDDDDKGGDDNNTDTGNDDDDDGKTKMTAASFFWVINNFSFFLGLRNTERELSRPERSGKRLKDARNWFLVSLLLL